MAAIMATLSAFCQRLSSGINVRGSGTAFVAPDPTLSSTSDSTVLTLFVAGVGRGLRIWNLSATGVVP